MAKTRPDLTVEKMALLPYVWVKCARGG
jgi:hypothetical protein